MEASSKASKILRSFPQDVQDYFLKIDNRCKRIKITLKVSSGKALNSDGGRCGGYFDERQKVLAVAIGGKLDDVISLLIHELTHCFGQWKNKSSIWYKKGIIRGHARFCRYLAGARVYKLKEATDAIIALEADCEKRAAKEIKKWPHIVDLKTYIRKANAYLMAHLHMMETGKWPKNSPYQKKIIAHCPDKFLRSYKEIPQGLKKAFNRHLT